jgi:threonine/homoserine/homoserine lactone efflux protein
VHSIFVKGLIIGFALAAPVGPVAALVVQRCTNRGLRAGLLSGLGSSTADLFYGTVAAFGASFVTDFFLEHGSWLQRVGGAILVILGIRLFLSKPPSERLPVTGGTGGSPLRDFLSTFLLTFTNPMTFLAFTAIFATMGLGASRRESILTAELIAGLSAGALVWWWVLALAVHAVRHRFDYGKLVWVNRATGIFVIGVGVLYLFVLRSDTVEPRLQRELNRIAPHPTAHAPRPTPA